MRLPLIVSIAVMILFNASQSFVIDNATRWQLYDWGKLITPLIFITWLYIELKPGQVFKKCVALFFMIDQFKECLDMIMTGNANDDYGLMWQSLILLLSLLFCIYKANHWNYERIKSDQLQDDGLYLLLLPPNNMFHFFGSIFGIGGGHVSLIARIDNRTFGYRKRDNKLFQFDHLINGKLIYLPVKEVHSFLGKICVNKKFNIITHNCITAYSIALKEAGIPIRFWKLEFIPQIFIKNLLYGDRNNNR
jgi:hypothetical protein